MGVIGPAEPDYKQEIQFSGGSFSRKDLYLFMVDLDQKVSGLVHLMPFSAQASIRSCFNEADQQRREANCMDQYRYDAVLKAVAGGQSYPDLQVTTQATRAPAGPAAMRIRASCRRRRRRSRSRRPTNSAAIP